jgi:hypothetical protein
MDLPSVLPIVETAVSSGLLAMHVRDWFRKKAVTGADPNIEASVRALPPTASPQEVAQVVRELYAGYGGDLNLAAGSDGGGHLRLTNAHVEAGAGPMRGGDLLIKGGDGGPHGKGGATVIIGGTYKAGDAK